MNSPDESKPILPRTAHQRIHDLLSVWQAISRERRPSETDFPTETLVKTHPGYCIIDRIESSDGGLDFCYRSVGPEHLQRTLADLKGSRFSQVLDLNELPRALEVYEDVYQSRQPHYWEKINMILNAPPTRYGRLLVPLYGDDNNVSCVLGTWVWQDG